MTSTNFINGPKNEVQINGGKFVNTDKVIYNTSNQPLDILHQHIAPGAFLDSTERFDPPRCDNGTRLIIIERIMDWITYRGSRSSILWLHGPAGAGKSALAQTIGERCKELGILAAAFFFSRNSVSSERSDGNRLIASLVHQLAESFPKIRPYIEKRIGHNSRIFDLGMQAQAESLLVYPLNKMSKTFRFLLTLLSTIFQSTYPRLFIVDGLDECLDTSLQCEILKVLVRAAKDLKLPFRILVASRPESHIVNFYRRNRDVGEVPVHRLDLARDRNSANDIQAYLNRRFDRILNTHPLREYIPLNWPTEEEIEKIVSHSSGQFIYAATVIKYIQSPRHQPTDRLKVIMGILEVPFDDKPYAALDDLYTLIFSVVSDPRAMEIFSVLAIPRTFDDGLGTFNTPEMIDKLLFFQPGSTLLILTDFSSIVDFDKKDSPIKHYHASLNDFLLEASRSGHFCVDLSRTHERLARGYLHLIQEKSDNGDWETLEPGIVAFVKHYGRLTAISANLATDLANMQYSCFSVSLISRYIRNHTEYTSDGFLPLYRLWDSGTMEQLFRQLTKSSLDNPGILQAQLDNFRQNPVNGVLGEITERLRARLRHSQFKKSIFCSSTACDPAKNEYCLGCQNISPLATELSYILFYAQIFSWGVCLAYDPTHRFELEMQIKEHLKYVLAATEDMVSFGSENQMQPSPTYVMFGIEAHLDCVVITLPSAEFSAELWEFLHQFETSIDSRRRPIRAFHRLWPRFQELQAEIAAYQRRLWDIYKMEEQRYYWGE